MTTNNNLDALFTDAELPFGHPGRRFDDTPEYFDRSLLMNQEPERDCMPDGDDDIVHYAPGDHPLCGTESMTVVYTDDPAMVAGCPDCLELAAEDLDEDNEHWANCLHCQQETSARNGVEWRRVVCAPCPHCGKPRW